MSRLHLHHHARPVAAVVVVLAFLGTTALAAAGPDSGAVEVRAGTDGVAAATGPQAAAETTAGAIGDALPPDSGSRYLVRRGDTLARVARLHAVSVEDLAALNGLHHPYRLTVGDRLSIPVAFSDLEGQPPSSLVGSDRHHRYDPLFDRWAAAYGVEAELLKAVAWRESRWRADARSHKGAVGIGQLLPSTATWTSRELIGTGLDIWDPEDNIRMSARYLRWLIEQSAGDEAAALAAYYQGISSVRRGWYIDTSEYVADIFALRPRFRA
jgi:N-acetylmuramoyl-L-alanine amidase